MHLLQRRTEVAHWLADILSQGGQVHRLTLFKSFVVQVKWKTPMTTLTRATYACLR